MKNSNERMENKLLAFLLSKYNDHRIIVWSVAAVVIGLLFILALTSGSSAPAQPVRPTPTPIPGVSHYINKWEANSVSFENQYYGRRIVVRGKVESVSNRILEEGYRITMIENFDTMDCNVTPENRRMATSVSKDQYIVVTGTIDSGFLGPDLYDCTVR